MHACMHATDHKSTENFNLTYTEIIRYHNVTQILCDTMNWIYAMQGASSGRPL
jgi:hypothetical protein